MARLSLPIIAISTILAQHARLPEENQRPLPNKSPAGQIIEKLREMAEGGDAQAQFALGSAYYAGIMVRRNFTEAAKWLTVSAEHGDENSQFYLGELYRSGEGVKRNYAEAVRLYDLSASAGYVAAQYRLGLMYQQGHGVKRNLISACDWYTKAAEQDYRPAQVALSVLYFNGEQIKRNLVKAYVWALISERGIQSTQSLLPVIRLKMSGEQIDEAHRIAADWIATLSVRKKAR